MDSSSHPVLPTIHLNGTGRDTLLREYSQARKALFEAQSAFSRITVHGRDYYPQGPAAFYCAQAERTQLWSHFQAIERHLTAHIDHLELNGPPRIPS